MVWFRVDDSLPGHEKVEKLEADPMRQAVAMAAWLLLGADSAARLTEGRITPARVAKVLAHWPKSMREKAVDALLDCKLWERVEDDGNYQFHDWSDYQPSKEEVDHDRKMNRLRQREWKRRKKKGNASANAVTDAVTGAVTDAVSNGVDNSSANGTPARAPAGALRAFPSRPVPSRPIEAEAAAAPEVLDEASRLAAALMLAHDELAPGSGSIGMSARAEAGSALYGRAVALRAEIEGSSVQALGDELIARFIDVFRDDRASRERGYPPSYLVTSLRGDALARASDLVRHAHGQPLSPAWKGPRPAMASVPEGRGSPIPELTAEQVADMEEALEKRTKGGGR